jgi:ABC-type bacteriocin/lantibiotic exporter with double-glycine peptidase domain
MISFKIHSILFCDIKFLRIENKALIHNSQLVVHSKEKVALIGRNGSGKSTLIRLIINFYDKKNCSRRYRFFW